MAYYVLLDGSQEGPYEIATVDRLVREGRVDRETYVWTAGMADWAFAGFGQVARIEARQDVAKFVEEA